MGGRGKGAIPGNKRHGGGLSQAGGASDLGYWGSWSP